MFNPGDRVRAVHLGTVVHEGGTFTGTVTPGLEEGAVYTIDHMRHRIAVIKEVDGAFFPERFVLVPDLDPRTQDLIAEYEAAQ
jgi:hypothetical protein